MKPSLRYRPYSWKRIKTCHGPTGNEAFTRRRGEPGRRVELPATERADGPEEGPAITVYRLQACPFCERAVRKLNELDLEDRSRFVEPMHSEREVVKRVTDKRSVPAIVDEDTGVTMSESANIVEYLEATYADG